MLSPDPDEGLTDHDPSLCLECRANAGPSPSRDPGTVQQRESIGKSVVHSSRGLFNSLGNTFKAKTAGMKEKLIDYIVNPNASSDERHVKSTDKEKSKPYRNLGSVFSIGGVEESDDSPESKCQCH
jgi:hypothetical protein